MIPINLPAEARTSVATLLNQLLADTIDLSQQAKQAHWIVRGPNFVGLHELFDTVAEQAQEHADELAERVVQLGAAPDGTIAGVVTRTRLPRYPTGTLTWSEHVRTLGASLSALATHVRAAIALAEEYGDAGTADLFTQISRDLDKSVWMVSSHAD
ncbi:MAG: DNA starvation/stationary phase protection protein Dps [Planctomycetota bacterium]|nr:DNA starvation/stationary phase protection protein Dps [Planctomycetota bacterium]